MLCFASGMYASWHGYGGRAFAATFSVFALYFGVMLLSAAPAVPNLVSARFGPRTGFVLGLTLFLGYLIYAFGTNTFSLAGVAIAAAFIFVPLAVAATAGSKSAGAWQDFVIVAAVWVVVKFLLARRLWPYPGGRLAYVFTVLLAVDIAIATFLLVRKLPGLGYTIAWGKAWAQYALGSFCVFALIAIPLGLAIHFLVFAPRWSAWRPLPVLFLAILCFTAWPEELLFRGLLQNLLARSMKSDLVGWCIASVLFGFSHITNGGFPNWRYAILATIAGLFYGWTWRKTGSIFASALVHALVDALWHFLFRTL